MNIKIRKCELSDSNIRTVIRFSQNWANEDLSFGYCANDKSDIAGSDLFLAYEGDKTIGYLFGRCRVLNKGIAPLEDGAKCFEIEEIYVKKENRSQGVGKILFEYAESFYKNTVDYITLSTATKNYKSILHFYIEKMDMSFWSAKLFKKI